MGAGSTVPRQDEEHPATPTVPKAASKDAHTAKGEGGDTYSFEGVVARVLHIRCTRVVDLDYLAHLSGHRDQERVYADRGGRRRVIFGRGRRGSVAVLGSGGRGGCSLARARSHAALEPVRVVSFRGGGLAGVVRGCGVE